MLKKTSLAKFNISFCVFVATYEFGCGTPLSKNMVSLFETHFEVILPSQNKARYHLHERHQLQKKDFKPKK